MEDRTFEVVCGSDLLAVHFERVSTRTVYRLLRALASPDRTPQSVRAALKRASADPQTVMAWEVGLIEGVGLDGELSDGEP